MFDPEIVKQYLAKADEEARVSQEAADLEGLLFKSIEAEFQRAYRAGDHQAIQKLVDAWPGSHRVSYYRSEMRAAVSRLSEKK